MGFGQPEPTTQCTPEATMAQDQSNRFASYGTDGRLLALVAEGLPEYPDDITTLSDEDLGALHDAYVEEARGLSTAENFDPARAAELTSRIPALRAEAAARLAAADAELAELAALSDEDRTAVSEYAVAVAAAAAAGPSDEDRAASLAALEAALNPPAPTIEPETLLAQVRQVDPALVAEAMAAGVARGFAPLLEGVSALTTQLREAPAPLHAAPNRRITAAELASYNRQGEGHVDPPSAPAPRGHLVMTGDVPGMQLGQEFTELPQLTEAFMARHRDIGTSTGTQDEKVLVASYRANAPSELRDLRGLTDGGELRRRINRVVGPEAIGVDPFNLGRELPIGRGGIAVENPEALVASGGLGAPVEPYYGQLVLAQAARPFSAVLPGMVADRGGIRLVLPASLGTLSAAKQLGAFADGVTDNSTAFASATAVFTAADLNMPIIQSGGSGSIIPPGTVIDTVTDAGHVVLSNATTGGVEVGVAFFLPARNPNALGGPVGQVTAAQDAAGPPNTIKYTYDVPIGVQAEFDVYSTYISLQFANLTARTFPEQVEANILLANALAARVAEQKVMDVVTGWSTMLTFAKTFGTARQLLAQFDHLAAYYRNFNRMDPAVVLRLGIPAWVLNAMRGDYISTFIGGKDNWGLSDDELNSWFQDRSVLPFFYWDGPSDTNQLFATVGGGAINTNGVNNATPVPVPDYPGTGSAGAFRSEVVSFMWAEGTWLGLTTGELNLGLVRDSVLNSQNRFRNFQEVWETPAFVGVQSLRTTHTIASDGTYGIAAAVALGAGNGL
jgi:hypothetical protein